MFDLFRSRAKITRYMMGGLLMLVAVMMVVTLIPGFNAPSRSEGQVLAEVGGQEVSIFEAQRAVQAQMQNRNITPQLAAIFVPQIVKQMVTEYAMAYEAQRMGFQVTDADMASAIRSTLPLLWTGGNFLGQEAYASVLREQNMTIPQFETTLRRQLMIEKLQMLIALGVVASDKEIEAEYHRRFDSVKIEYIEINPVKFRSIVQVSPEEVQAYWGKNLAKYQMPERRSFQMLVVDEGKLASAITIPDAELRREYDQNKDSFRVPERVHVRHILLKTTDKPKEEIAGIKAKAEEVLKQVRAGADFADLAKKNSEDTASAAKGGDLDWVVRGQTVKAFEDAAFSLKPKEISNVITTEYGFHILQVMEKEEAHLKPFDEVKAQLADELKKRKVYDEVQRLADQARKELVKNPEAAEKIAAEPNLELVRGDRVGPGEAARVPGSGQEVDGAISSLRKNEVSQVMEISPTRLGVAVVTEVIPARQAELPEVESKIKEELAQGKLTRMAEDRAKEALDKANEMKGDLKKAAQALKLDWKEVPAFTRDGAAEGLGSASYVEAAFTHDAGYVFGPVTVNEVKYVCKVAAKIPADMSKFAAQRQDLADQVKGIIARERVELFAQNLSDRLVKEGKLKIHQDAINRMATSYSGSTQ